jgi:hypothetical protein
MFSGHLSWRTALNLDKTFLDYRKGKDVPGEEGDGVLFSWESN